MSGEPLRKSNPRKDVDQRIHSNSVEASGDATPRKKPSRSKSKCRIPKSLRYDLENALVGLCDVWFEEIKPYLVENNIKIHLHNNTGDGSGDRGLVAGNCSHLDPGRPEQRRHTDVSCADCCSAQPTVLKAQRRKQPPPQPLAVAATTQTPYKWKKQKTRNPRQCRQTEPRQPIPRLCHAYNLPLLLTKEKYIDFTQNQYLHHYKDLISRKPKLKHVYTQTDTICPGRDKAVKKIFNKNYTTSKPQSYYPCPDLAHKENQHDKDNPLFPDDLIELIAKKHDKKLQVLYVSPRKDNSSSTMNLCVPSNAKRGSTGFYKIPPWR